MSSPSKQKRASIANINSQYSPVSNSDHSSRPWPSQRSLAGSLRSAFRQSWPAWGSIREFRSTFGGCEAVLVNFTVSIANCYRLMGQYGGTQVLVNETEDFVGKVRAIYCDQWTPAKNETFYSHLENTMIEAVFGSNYIENAGLNKGLTMKLCRDIFRGINIKAEDIDERDPDYVRYIQDSRKSKDAVIRERREVIQHAKALEYIVDMMVHKSVPLSEQLIKTAHKILMEDQHEDIKHGEYRNYKIAVRYGKKKGGFEFIHYRAVPEYMSNLCDEYSKEIGDSEKSGQIDPISLAAKYCNQFVNIHPFGDGNGRMARLLMNAVLLKYAGTCIPIGEGGNVDRDEYLGVARRCGDIFYQEDHTVEEKTSHRELGVLILKKSRAKLRELCLALK